MWSCRCQGPGLGPGSGPARLPELPRADRRARRAFPLVAFLVVLVLASLPSALDGKPTASWRRATTPSPLGTRPSPPPCPRDQAVVVTGRRLADGGLESKDGHVFPPGTYYTTEDADDTLGCPCQAGICFFKCCPLHQIQHDGETKGCGNVTDALTASLVSTRLSARAYPDAAARVQDLFWADNLTAAMDSGASAGASAGAPSHWQVLTGRPKIEMFKLNSAEPSDRFVLLANGSLLVPNLTALYAPGEFCMDVWNVTTVEGNTTSWSLEMSALVPFPDDEVHASSEQEDIMNILYPAGLLISLPFLVVTFAVYCSFSELQNLHGKSLRCHVGSMTVAYLVLVLVQFKVGVQYDRICIGLGFCLQFSFLACFFWLNVMCFDIWRTFSGFRGAQGSPHWAEKERHRFLWYSLWAWGWPLAILSVTVGAQLLTDYLPAFVINPMLGNNYCYFGSSEAKYVYFIGPVGVLLLCNTGLFLHTAIRIVQLRRETSALKNAESRRHSDERQRYNVYLKLFVIMGVSWLAEIMSHFTTYSSVYLWIIPDVTNSLQGIFIFIMFVGTGRVRRLVVDRLLNRRVPNVTSISSTKTTKATQCNGSRTSVAPAVAPAVAPPALGAPLGSPTVPTISRPEPNETKDKDTTAQCDEHKAVSTPVDSSPGSTTPADATLATICTTLADPILVTSVRDTCAVM